MPDEDVEVEVEGVCLENSCLVTGCEELVVVDDEDDDDGALRRWSKLPGDSFVRFSMS